MANRVQNKNALKSDRAATAGKTAAAQQDTFGSRHNRDAVKAAQERKRPKTGKRDLAVREGAQDQRKPTGARRSSTRSGRSGKR